MTWPTSSATTEYLDSTDDKPSLAVPELKGGLDKLNEIIAHAGEAGKALLAATNQNAARTVLDVGFASGTKMLFQQTAAPTGWTKDATHNNKALRIVSGTAGSGGSVAFTTAFASKAVTGTVGSTTLSEGQMPYHNHPVSLGNGASSGSSQKGAANHGSLNGSTTFQSDWRGGNQAHAHSFTGTAINMAVQYVDVIIATKD